LREGRANGGAAWSLARGRELAPIALAVALTACMETAPPPPVEEFAISRMSMREGVSLARATVAVTSIDGPPATFGAEFSAALSREAAERHIVVADPRRARYLLRGYLAAAPIPSGARIAFVWDLFDRDGRRARRTSDVVDVAGADAETWSSSDASLAATIARSCAEDIAAVLSNTPEAARESGAAVGPGALAAAN
jgi:hypothetical protein